ncbi:MAG: hypothetical protein K1X89_17715 [Myxococcaceae bacterium]|nr:hypothetical protein [Myxococcaceae bacterium]
MKAIFPFLRALSRALKAVGFYERGHPILTQLLRETHQTLVSAAKAGPVVLACAGTKLRVAEKQPPLGDPTAKALAEHLFKRSLVCVRFPGAMSLSPLSTVLEGLSLSPEELKAAGGLNPWLALRHIEGVEVVELDFAQLFEGKTGAIDAKDPLAKEALQDLLRFHEGKSKASSAFQVSLQELGSPESLGGFLDDLLDAAGPGVVEKAAAPGEVRGVRGKGSVAMADLKDLSADDVAELAAQAYGKVVEEQLMSGAEETTIGQSAKVLSRAMVRLSPQARFNLLKQLAEQAPGGNGLAPFAQELDDESVMQVALDALMGQGSDPDTVASVGQLLKQLRPLESDRRKFLQGLDQTLAAKGKPLEGVLWQELQASAFGNDAQGMLEVPWQVTSKPLAEIAAARLAFPNNPPEIKRVLALGTPQVLDERVAALLHQLMGGSGELTAAQLSSLKEAVEKADVEQPPGESLVAMLRRLVQRVDQNATPAETAALRSALTGARGAVRTLWLLRPGGRRGSATLAAAMLAALDAPMKIDQRRELLGYFAQLDEEALKPLRPRVMEVSAAGVQQLVMAAARLDVRSGLELARTALRNKDFKARGAGLRALAAHPTADVLALMRAAAGVDGDDVAKKLFGLEAEGGEKGDELLLHAERAAIEALGATRSEAAVPALENLLTRKKLLGGKRFDLLRPDAARALALNATPAARAVLQAGKTSTHDAVRDACVKV